MNELQAALDALAAIMLERGMPHLDWLRPGLPPEEVRATLTQAGYPVTEEIVTWFSWHNGGIRGDDVNGVNGRIAFAGHRPFRLSEALLEADANWRVYQEAADEDESIAEEYVDNPWRSRWIPVLTGGGGGCLAADLASDIHLSPVIAVGWESSPYEWPRLPSLNALIEVHIDLIREDATWSPQNRGFEIIWDHTTFKDAYRWF